MDALKLEISPSAPNVYQKKILTRNGKTRLYTVVCGQDGNARIPSFTEVQISTMTVIAHTNLVVNTDKLYKLLPVTDYLVLKKKRGRKKKIQPEDPNRDVPPGSIISLTKKHCVRGISLKKKKSKTFFRHSVSIVMILEDQKMLNVKVSRNGKFQMTGCKTLKHAVEFTKYLYGLMIEAEEWTGETLFTYKDQEVLADEDLPEESSGDDEDPQNLTETEPPLNREKLTGLQVIFRVVMMNLDLDLGYRVRRDLLNTYINRYTDFRSIFESSIGTSVNIKIKALRRFDTQLVRLRITGEGECLEDLVPYEEFFASLTPKEQKDEGKKESYHTFLVFASGSIIMSSAGVEMPMIFNKLIRLLVEHRKKIEERHEDHETIVDSAWLDANPESVSQVFRHLEL